MNILTAVFYMHKVYVIHFSVIVSVLLGCLGKTKPEILMLAQLRSLSYSYLVTQQIYPYCISVRNIRLQFWFMGRDLKTSVGCSHFQFLTKKASQKAECHIFSGSPRAEQWQLPCWKSCVYTYRDTHVPEGGSSGLTLLKPEAALAALWWEKLDTNPFENKSFIPNSWVHLISEWLFFLSLLH